MPALVSTSTKLLGKGAEEVPGLRVEGILVDAVRRHEILRSQHSNTAAQRSSEKEKKETEMGIGRCSFHGPNSEEYFHSLDNTTGRV